MTFKIVFESYPINYPTFNPTQKIQEVKEIPTLKTIDLFEKNNYNIIQLKQIAKHYHLKRTGTKPILIKRIIHFLILTNHCIKIQKEYRKHVIRTINHLHGPAFINRKMCTNISDFYTLEPLSEIHIRSFISYTDEDNFTYGFKISSLYDLFIKAKRNAIVLNPYNRTPFPKIMLHIMRRLYYLGEIMNIDIQLEEEEEEEEENTIQDNNPYNQLISRTAKLFQRINDLENNASQEWFLSLNRSDLLQFFKELSDIWNYRMMLSSETKYFICPQGNPFRGIELDDLENEFIFTIQKYLVTVMENMVYYGISDEFKKLGSFYILGALTIVNNNAAETIPWLYESFI